MKFDAFNITEMMTFCHNFTLVHPTEHKIKKQDFVSKINDKTQQGGYFEENYM